jgi:hypothetical protein
MRVRILTIGILLSTVSAYAENCKLNWNWAVPEYGTERPEITKIKQALLAKGYVTVKDGAPFTLSINETAFPERTDACRPFTYASTGSGAAISQFRPGSGNVCFDFQRIKVSAKDYGRCVTANDSEIAAVNLLMNCEELKAAEKAGKILRDGGCW